MKTRRKEERWKKKERKKRQGKIGYIEKITGTKLSKRTYKSK